MVFSLYLLSILYTNTMGLIIISKCKPILNKQIENKGYRFKEMTDADLMIKTVTNCLKFLIPGYFLKKALNMTNKNYDINILIKEKIGNNEIVKDELFTTPIIDSIYNSNSKHSLSLGRYEKSLPYKAESNVSSMYTDERNFGDKDMDMDFWEEENIDSSYIEDREEVKEIITKEPIEEYISTITDEELIEMANQLDKIRKLKKANEEFLNNKVA